MITVLDILTVLALWLCLAVGYGTVHFHLAARKRHADLAATRKALSAVSLLAAASVVIFAFIYTEAWIVVLSILTTTFLAAYSVGDMDEPAYRLLARFLPLAEAACVVAAVLSWSFLRW